MEYSPKLMDHFNNPRNVGTLDDADPQVGTGVAGSPVCGDLLKLQIRVGSDGRITEAKFKTFGCGASVASSSYATELLIGKTVEQALQIRNADIVEELNLPAIKIHCSVLTEEAVRAAVDNWRAKHGQDPGQEPAPDTHAAAAQKANSPCACGQSCGAKE